MIDMVVRSLGFKENLHKAQGFRLSLLCPQCRLYHQSHPFLRFHQSHPFKAFLRVDGLI